MKKYAAMVLTVLLAVLVGCAAADVGLDVQKRTIEQIESFISSHPTAVSGEYYAEDPVLEAPYSPGSLTQAALQSGLNAVNQARYVAGLSSNITLNEAYNEKCQAGALVNAVNRVLDHHPDQPEDMDEDLYKLGYSGTSSSNLAAGYSTLARAVLYGWMDDGDSSNIDRIGHRRWVLSPSMGQTGLGQVGYFTAMYAFDVSGSANVPKRIAWPAQVMPARWMYSGLPWCVLYTGTLGSDASIGVTIQRVGDGQTWNFGTAGSDGYFHIDRGNYGWVKAVIFRPNEIRYTPGDIYEVTVTGAESDTLKYTVEIYSFDMAYADIEEIPDQAYTGGEARPALKVSMGSIALVEGQDYEVTYENNVKASNYAKATVTGLGKYEGSQYTYFKILPKNLSEVACSEIEDMTYRGWKFYPEITLTDGGTTLTQNTDYRVEYENNLDVGEGTVVVTGRGNYTGERRIPFQITAADIGEASVYLKSSYCVYHGVEQKPEVSVSYQYRTLKENQDYTLSYRDNIEVGKGTIIVTGQGNFTGTLEEQFQIWAISLSQCEVEVVYGQNSEDPTYRVTLGEVELVEGTDYTIEVYHYYNQVYVYIYGTGHYRGNAYYSYDPPTLTPAPEATPTPAPGEDVVEIIILPEDSEEWDRYPEDTGNTPSPEEISQSLPPTAGTQMEANGQLYTMGDYDVIYDGPTNRSAKTVSVPGSVLIRGNLYPVRSISEGAFQNMTKLKEVTLGGNVETIGKSAFEGCTALKTVNGGEAVTSIGEKAFKGCSALTAIGIGARVKTIGNEAFASCGKLTRVTGCAAVTSVGNSAFKNCKALTEISLKKATAIGKNAFYGCAKLKTVTLGSTLKTIGDSAFSGCKALEKITLPKNVEKIGKKAFYGCKKLKTITIKTKKLTSSNVGSNAFKGIYSKAAIKCPSSLKSDYKKLLLKKGVTKKAVFK